MEITLLAGPIVLFLLMMIVGIAVAAIVAMSGLERLDLTFFSGVYATAGYPILMLAVWLRRRRHPATAT
jgi:hypothetical protein